MRYIRNTVHSAMYLRTININKTARPTGQGSPIVGLPNLPIRPTIIGSFSQAKIYRYLSEWISNFFFGVSTQSVASDDLCFIVPRRKNVHNQRNRFDAKHKNQKKRTRMKTFFIGHKNQRKRLDWKLVIGDLIFKYFQVSI